MGGWERRMGNHAEGHSQFCCHRGCQGPGTSPVTPTHPQQLTEKRTTTFAPNYLLKKVLNVDFKCFTKHGHLQAFYICASDQALLPATHFKTKGTET